MNNQTCPYLGIPGPETEQNKGRDYPSFENCCFAESEPSFGSLLLADQSTYCLSGGHHQCPRFQSVSLQGNSSSSFFPQSPVYSSPLIDPVDIPTTSIPLDSEYLTSAVDLPDYGFESEYQEDVADDDERLNPLWLLAGTTFVTVFLAGIGLALFLGWHLISSSALADIGSSSVAGSNTLTLADVSEAEDAVYVVLTATPDGAAAASDGAVSQGSQESDNQEAASLQPAEINQNGNNVVLENASGLAVISEPLPTVPVAVLQPADGNQQSAVRPNFPAAVTPTPIIVTGANNGQVNSGVQSAAASGQVAADQIVRAQDVTNPNSVAQNVPPTLPPPPTLTPVPEINVQVLIPDAPTRRPTPAVPIIPTVVEVPTDTPVPTATWPPPVVFFSPVDRELKEGKCTKITWDVQNVRAVYVASLGVDGKGEKEVCIKDKSKVFDLAVVLPNGSTKLYTTTVELEEPTPTPTPTLTYTPLPIPTATWTPVPPTVTPEPTLVPVLVRGAKLDTAQPQGAEPISCTAGTSCQIGLLATNSGEGVDNLVIVLAERSQPGWPVLLCRQDGVCSTDRLILINVGQANTAFVTLQLEAPADAAGQMGSFQLYAASQEAGEAVRSDTLLLNVTIP